MLPSRDFSLLAKPSWSLGSSSAPLHIAVPQIKTSPAPTAVPTQAPVAVGAWRDHVKGVYASLKAVDPSTSYKEAMTHAKASWKK
jgi:hypothetical protein